MSLINKEIADFSAQAFIKAAGAEKGKFKTITKADLLDKWSVLFSILLILLLYVLPN